MALAFKRDQQPKPPTPPFESRSNLVGGRNVHPWYSDVIETQVNSELRPVMDQMIDEAADNFGASLSKREPVTEPERPVFLHVRVRRSGKACPPFLDAFVESLE